MNKRYIPFFPIFSIIKLTFQNGGVSLNKIPFLILYLIRYIILEPFRLLELILFERKIVDHQLKHQPLFILGHWRSGTSHLQNLMRLDPNTTSATIYTSLFPDNYFLTEPWLKRILNFACKIFKVEYAIQRCPMDMDIPGELDTALCSLCNENSYTWAHLFPKKYERIFLRNILFQNNHSPDEWLGNYDYLIRKLSYGSGGKRVVVKSPGDTARVLSLKKQYPHACFVYIHRDPYHVFHSNEYLWKVIQKQNAIQTIDDKRITDLIIWAYEQLLKSYISQREIISEQLLEIDFEDLQKEPIAAIKQIYFKFHLENIPMQALNDFILANRSYRSPNYQTSPELLKRINEKWDFAFKEWHYKKIDHTDFSKER